MAADQNGSEWYWYKGQGFHLQPPNKNSPLSLHLHSWSSELEEVILRSGVTSVWVTEGGGWYDDEHSLRFLTKFAPQIRSLVLEVKAIEDRSFVGTFVNLEKLSLRYSVNGIDFSQLSRLQNCVIEEVPSPGNIGTCSTLRDLTIRSVKKLEDFTALASLKQLRKLLLDSVPLRSLRHIEQLQALRELHLVQCRRLESLAGVEHTYVEELWLDILPRLHSIAPLTQRHTLKKLEIGSCKQIDDLECIAEIPSLETLWIMTGREIPSLEFLRGMENLRDFRTFGTKIVDGNLSILLELPKLEQVVIHRHMRHYSHTEEQLNGILAARRQSE